jgi:amidase
VASVELTRALLDRIDLLDGSLASYARVLPEEALAAAAVADEEIAAGRYRGPLHGVPLGVKDLFWMKGAPTAAGTMIHRDFVPDEDATVVARLRQAGAILLGKLQLTEGAYSDYHPAIEPPKNPWNPTYWTGISSSGSAVATAAGLCFGSLASDTGGSIRWPCGATGLTGIKPAWGRVSRFGVFELAPSLDHVGSIARSAADAATILAAVAGHDDKDPTTLAEPQHFCAASSNEAMRGFRLGIDARWNGVDVDPSVQRVLADAERVFRSLGVSVMPVVAPDVTQSVIDWAPACALEAAVAHRHTFPARRDEYGPVLSSVLESGRAVSALDYQGIRLRRMDLRGRFTHLFRSIDALLMPVQPFGPLKLTDIDALGARPDLVLRLQRYTAPFDLTGHPTVTLPGGFGEGSLPIGFQLAGRCETTLLRAALAFQGETAWHGQHPPIDVPIR